MIFRACQFEFSFPRPVVIMGIVNVTPDSFSDGGKYCSIEDAVAHAARLAHEGAEILDIGGESTRPGAVPVSPEEELSRVVPVVERIRTRLPETPISVDTRKVEVAAAAIDAGATIINDIAANREKSDLWKLVASSRAGYVAMHMLGDPQTMQNAPEYEDVVLSVESFFEERMSRFADAGIAAEQIVLDVGIGFGKTVRQNLQLLGALSGFQRFNRPLLLGASRKSFIGALAIAEAGDRLPGSLAAAVLAARDGVQMVRVHDVAATRQALQVAEAINQEIKTCRS